MNFEQVKELDQQNVLHSYARFDLAIAEGKGAVCKDYDGREYVDFSSGIGVNSLGYCDPEWAAAIAKQAGTLQHTSNLYYTAPCAQAAKLLCDKTGYSKVFFANSGAEANEGAIKAARKYSYDKYGEGRYEIITLVNSFHGRTVTTLKATGQEVFHKYFFPFTEGFVYAQANNLQDVAAKISDKTCAVMMEFVQGEGGVISLEAGFVKGVFDLCAQKDLLVIGDEVQTGVGRTGSLFCCQQYGVQPDILTAAKGLGGGLPVGAVLFNQKTSAVLGPGDHATTFGGNPVVCAGVQVVLNRLTDSFLQEVAQKGQYLRDKISRMSKVTGVSGKGLMLGVALEGITSREAVARCIEKGLIALTAKEKLRLLPPLTITYEEMDRGIAVLAEVLDK